MVSVCLPSDALSAPTILLGFLLPWMWGISSQLLQQSAALEWWAAKRRYRTSRVSSSSREEIPHVQGKWHQGIINFASAIWYILLKRVWISEWYKQAYLQMKWYNIRDFLNCCCCSSVSKLCLISCDPMDCSTPGFADIHYLLEFAQTHVHTSIKSVRPSNHLILSPHPFPLAHSLS